MGVQTMNILLGHATNGGHGTVKTGDIFGTSFIEMVRVPLELPPVYADYNYIGNLRYMGIALFAVMFLMSLFFASWTFSKRHVRVVAASQPQFLLMICFGVLISASSLLTISFDDSEVGYYGSTANGLCMSIPWLTSLGFTIMFSALFSKTRRINKIFHNPFPYRKRLKVSLRELYLPMVLLFTANVVDLTLWTFIAPLKYVREVHAGTDGWNRAISSHGTCTSDGTAPFIATLFLINMSTIMVANWQSYVARDIRSEFSESRCIAIAMACILQASLTGVPILFLTQEIPTVRYVVFVLMIFVVNAVVLLLIFVPKILSERISQEQNEDVKRHHLEAVDAERMELRLKCISLKVNNESGDVNDTPGDGMGLSRVAWSFCEERRSSAHDSETPLEPIPALHDDGEGHHDGEGNSPNSVNLQAPPAAP
jgi:gamma-aminobutyric acid type B receptor